MLGLFVGLGQAVGGGLGLLGVVGIVFLAAVAAVVELGWEGQVGGVAAGKKGVAKIRVICASIAQAQRGMMQRRDQVRDEDNITA